MISFSEIIENINLIFITAIKILLIQFYMQRSDQQDYFTSTFLWRF